MANHTARRAAVVLTALLQILTPLLPGFGYGTPIGARSDAVQTIITPAGWAFAIWGALYTGAAAYAVYQLVRSRPLLERTGWPAAGAFLGNAAWAAWVQFHGLDAVSVAIIGFTLACLLVIYRRFAAWPHAFSTGERLLAVLPLSALAAWLTAATIVNISATLTFHGVDAGANAPVIGAGVIALAGLIAGTALLRGRGNQAYAAVFLWALAGIWSAGGQLSTGIAAACILAAMLVIAGAARGWRQSHRGTAIMNR
jgi:hypothetical protein